MSKRIGNVSLRLEGRGDIVEASLIYRGPGKRVTIGRFGKINKRDEKDVEKLQTAVQKIYDERLRFPTGV